VLAPLQQLAIPNRNFTGLFIMRNVLRLMIIKVKQFPFYRNKFYIPIVVFCQNSNIIYVS